jgi:hypothetical protein
LNAEQGEALATAVPPMAALLAASSPEPQQQPKRTQPEAPAPARATVSIQELKAAAEAAKQPPDAAAGGEQQEAAQAGSADEPAGATPHLSAEDDAAAAQLEVLHALLLLLPPPEVRALLHAAADLTHAASCQCESTWPGGDRHQCQPLQPCRAAAWHSCLQTVRVARALPGRQTCALAWPRCCGPAPHRRPGRSAAHMHTRCKGTCSVHG